MGETVASKTLTARISVGIDAEKRMQDRESNPVAAVPGVGSLVSAPSIFTVGEDDDAAGARRTITVEEPRQDPRVVDVANGVAHRVPRGAPAKDDAWRAPVVASQEEIVLAEQLRLKLERKYLNGA